MGILDDLAMGFGLKERTEDYDARTARTIALNEQYDNDIDRSRALRSKSYDVTRGGAAQYLGSRGRENYNPQIAQDDRPFMQRLLRSPQSAPSPTSYAIGPVKMDQALNLPSFSPIGMFMNILSGGNRDVPTVSADTSPMRVRPQSGYNLGGSAQPGTRFDTRTEAEPIDFSNGILVEDPATIAAKEALLSTPDVYDPSGEFGLRENGVLDPNLELITEGPHAGKYVDRSGRIRMP